MIAVVIAILLSVSFLPSALGESIDYNNSIAYTNCQANLREKPSTNSDRLEVLASGTKVLITETSESDDEVWCLVTVDNPNVTGYILLSLLDVVAKQQTKPSEDETLSSNITIVGEEYYLARRAQLIPQEETQPTFSEEELSQYQTITVGDRGANVLKLKDRMYELGYFNNKTNYDEFTDKTAEYVKCFQERNGLETTGIATPEMQALFYSQYAVAGSNANEDGLPKPDLEILNGIIINYGASGCAFQIQLKNNTNMKIDAFDIIAIPHSTYGYPVGLEDTIHEQINWRYEVERYTINAGKTFSCNAHNYCLTISDDKYYGGVIATISAYHTSAGDTVNTLSADSVWFGIGKGVTQGAYIPENITKSTLPTEQEKTEEASWRLGVYIAFIPVDYRTYYNVPEGLYIYDVDEGLIAERAGIRKGDIIIAIGDVLTNSETDLVAAKGRILQGDSAEVLFWREGEYCITTITRE